MKDKINELELSNRCCTEDGDQFDAGCSEDHIPYYISKCNEINADKNVCSVKNWQWLDLDLEEKIKNEVEQSEQQFCLIKADYVIDDQAGRFDEGDWVRSSLLLNFHENCVFETRNTFYILVGKGTRKSVDPKLVAAISNVLL